MSRRVLPLLVPGLAACGVVVALDQGSKALASLPAKYREAVVLCCLAGKTQEEAARQVGCPLGTCPRGHSVDDELLPGFQTAW